MSKNHRQNGTLALKSLDNDEKTSNHQLETDWLSAETLEITENFLHCPHCGAFCQILDIFVCG